jgi:hypothetical protein
MKISIFLVISCVALVACHSRFRENIDIDARKPGGICPVHDIPLQDDVIRITYGLIRPTKEETDARLKMFPRSGAPSRPKQLLLCPKWHSGQKQSE